VNEFYLRELSKIIGATIIGVVETPQTNDPWEEDFFGLKLEFCDGSIKVLWFLRDDEGNGPGSFSIEDLIPDIDAYIKKKEA